MNICVICGDYDADREGVYEWHGLIVVYIVFRIASKQLFGEFLSGDELTVVTFSLLAGIMIGRLLGMLRSVIGVLKEQNIV